MLSGSDEIQGEGSNDMLNGSDGNHVYPEEMAVTLLMVDQVMMNSTAMMEYTN